jgi:hypothetical protein
MLDTGLEYQKGRRRRNKTPLNFAMGILKTILPGKSGHVPQIAKAGFIASVYIYENTFPVSRGTR